MSDRPCNLCELKRIRTRYAPESLVEFVNEDGWYQVDHADGRPIAQFMRVPEECAC